MFDEDNGELICPYCGEIQQCHEPDDISANMCYTECEHCDKPFWYAVKVTREYESFKDDDGDDNTEEDAE